MFEQFTQWFLELGEQYGVDPVIFGLIYIGSSILFLFAVSWLIDNHRKGKSIILPAVTAALLFVSVYIYVIIAGENVSKWVYLLIIMVVLCGGYGVILKIRDKIVAVDHETGSLFEDANIEIK